MNWVVTGPIGAGKSLVSEYLARAGAVLVDADALGHRVLEEASIVKEVSREFGAGCVIDGRVDRRALGAVVFADARARQKLNALVHPLLLRKIEHRFAELRATGKHELAVLEAAVYFLWPPLPLIDLVVCVTAGEKVRKQRLMANRSLSGAEAARRLDAQRELDGQWTRADVVLENNGNRAALKAAVNRLLKEHGPQGSRVS